MSIKPERIGKRGYLFNFNKDNSPFPVPTCVYLVVTEKSIFICDTHTGPDSMISVRDYIINHFPDKRIIVFNTHFDWDHVWGNCAFNDSLIIAHKNCRELLEIDCVWKGMIEFNGQSMNGQAVRKLPDIVFETCLEFPDEGIKLFHSPGHSFDSCTLFDTKDNVLFTGDNLEEPIPILQWHGLDEYIATLEKYKNMNVETIISAHCGPVKQDLIQKHIEYMNDVKSGKVLELEKNIAFIHESNLKMLEFSIAEERLLKTHANYSFMPELMKTFGKNYELAPGELSKILSKL